VYPAISFDLSSTCFFKPTTSLSLFELGADLFGEVGQSVFFAGARRAKTRRSHLKQFFKVHRSIPIGERMGLENDPLDLPHEGIGHPVGGAELLDELLGQVSRAGVFGR
jgi:hypothetical protein